MSFNIQFDSNNQIYFEHNLNETDLAEANEELAQQIKNKEKKLEDMEVQRNEFPKKRRALDHFSFCCKYLEYEEETLKRIRTDIDSLNTTKNKDEEWQTKLTNLNKDYKNHLKHRDIYEQDIRKNPYSRHITLLASALDQGQKLTWTKELTNTVADFIDKQRSSLEQEEQNLPTFDDIHKLATDLHYLKRDLEKPRTEQILNQLLYDLLNAKKTGNQKQFNALIQQYKATTHLNLPEKFFVTYDPDKKDYSLENIKADELEKALNEVATSVRNDANNDAKLKVDFANDVYFAWTGIQLQQAFIHKGETEKVLSQITSAQEKSKEYTDLITSLTKLAGNRKSGEAIALDPAQELSTEQRTLLENIDPNGGNLKISSGTTVAQLDRVIATVRGAQQEVTSGIDQLMIQVNDHSHQYDNYIQGAHKALSNIEDLLSSIINKMA